ncbi:hypothetical protein Sthe_3348 [Sphaerobacter thermophilus DSM 20745]|uniref:Uncharacterized protein n=1 Tax=Sphaerobacter thermophilus (strain ATCC 49802 / DSM 20745 / KCCM 41009 / NCIMB 13125 / S 6022) TaxID=479434 RepID=D1CAA5_SPHTD|nr:hypothetical protein Sthe_3348 [Sphaerobacter thermophilus DSM 20745]
MWFGVRRPEPPLWYAAVATAAPRRYLHTGRYANRGSAVASEVVVPLSRERWL